MLHSSLICLQRHILHVHYTTHVKDIKYPQLFCVVDIYYTFTHSIYELHKKLRILNILNFCVVYNTFHPIPYKLMVNQVRVQIIQDYTYGSLKNIYVINRSSTGIPICEILVFYFILTHFSLYMYRFVIENQGPECCYGDVTLSVKLYPIWILRNIERGSLCGFIYLLHVSQRLQ